MILLTLVKSVLAFCCGGRVGEGSLLALIVATCKLIKLNHSFL